MPKIEFLSIAKKPENVANCSISRMQSGPHSGSPNLESGMADGGWRVASGRWRVAGGECIRTVTSGLIMRREGTDVIEKRRTKPI